jgi:hypothetical protein
MRRVFVLLMLCWAGCRRESAPNGEPLVKVKCVAPHFEPLDETLELPGRIEPPGRRPSGRISGGRTARRGVGARRPAHIRREISSRAWTTSPRAMPSVRPKLTLAQSALPRLTQRHARAGKSTRRRVVSLPGRSSTTEARAENERQAVASATAATHLAQRTLGRVQVRATFPGVVTRLWRGPGALVDGTAATPIVQVAASASAEFVAAATERELVQAESGQAVHVRLESAPQDLPGQVAQIRSSSL